MSATTLQGGLVVDGRGGPPVPGNVVIEGDRLTAVGDGSTAGQVIDAEGLVVAPGFVDIHSHVDWIVPLPDGPELLAANLLQGITTAVAGNCGISAAPIGDRFGPGALEGMPLVATVSHRLDWSWRSVDEFRAVVERRGTPLNVAMLAGHGSLRASVAGPEPRPASPARREELRALATRALDDGAVGISVGLEYAPGCYARTDELEALAELLPPRDGLLAAHTRGLSALYDPAMDEALGIAARTGCRLQLSHVNPIGEENWPSAGALVDRLRRLDDPACRYDFLPYTTWRVAALEVLPRAALELGEQQILTSAAEDDGRRRLRAIVESSPPRWPPWHAGGVTRNPILELGWEAMTLVEPASAEFEAHRGATLAAIARATRREPFAVYLDLVAASDGRAELLNDGYGGRSDEGPLIDRLAGRAEALVATDTVPLAGAGGAVHLGHRMFWGAMPRFVGRWSRDAGAMSPAEAVRRLTSAPAAAAGLGDRGTLRPGGPADVVAFDLEAIGETGTPAAPGPPSGIEHVFVNGAHVVRAGAYRPDRLGGRVLGGRR